jgi:hypothetical protein
MRSISLGAFLLAVIVVLLKAANAAAQTPSIDAAKAHQYFTEAKALSDRDNGALWKVQRLQLAFGTFEITAAHFFQRPPRMKMRWR